MKLSHNYYVYIIECSDQSYYTGITNDLNKRVSEHNEGIDQRCYTYVRKPVILKYYEHYTDVRQAIEREKQLKGWSRKKKEALINEHYDLLKEFSKSTLRRGSG